MNLRSHTSVPDKLKFPNVEIEKKTVHSHHFSLFKFESQTLSNAGPGAAWRISLLTIFKHSHHFSRTLGDVWWQSLMTPPHHHKNTTPLQKQHHKKTAPQKHHHTNTTTKTPPQHHKNTTTPPHHHTTTTTSILPQFSTVVRFSPVKNVHFTTVFHRSPVQSGQKRPFYHSFSP